jgi:hypothetical protein
VALGSTRTMLTALLNLLSDDVLRNASGLGVGVTLVLVSALGVLIAQLGHRGRPLLAALLLCGLFWLVASQRAMVFGATCAEVLVGSSVLIEEGGGNPEPETRLERRAPASWDHAHDARQARWANNTARALFVLFGPSPAAYRGPYPSRAEAARLLCERGETPTVVDGPALLLRGDATYALEPVDGEAILHIEAALGEPLMAISDDALPDLAFTRGDVTRVAPLSEDALLIETKDSIELRVWDRLHNGRVWARWRRPNEAEATCSAR